MRSKWSLILVAAFLITAFCFASSTASAAVAAGKERVQRKRVSLAADAVALAQQFLGVRYRYGGSSPRTGFDCSGFIMYIYGRLGISLPHIAAAQASVGIHVPRASLKPGDLVFFDGLGHAGIYIGKGRFIHSPRTGESVRIDYLSGHWSRGYVGARRVAA